MTIFDRFDGTFPEETLFILFFVKFGKFGKNSADLPIRLIVKKVLPYAMICLLVEFLLFSRGFIQRVNSFKIDIFKTIHSY